MTLLANNKQVYLEKLVDSNVDGLKTIDEVQHGIIHVIAHVIASDTEILAFIRKW